MKCLKCGADTAYSATSSLCPACMKHRKPRKPAVIGILIVGMCVVILIASSKSTSHQSSSAPAPASSTVSPPSTVKWSGSGPDCTPDGHPDPNHPGYRISSLYSDACPSGPASPPDPLLDAATLDSKYGIEASLDCGDGVDDYLRNVATYDFKWEDVGFMNPKFDPSKAYVTTRGVLTLFSKKALLQNGFGAYKHVTVLCDYDTQKQAVLDYRLQP